MELVGVHGELTLLLTIAQTTARSSSKHRNYLICSSNKLRGLVMKFERIFVYALPPQASTRGPELRLPGPVPVLQCMQRAMASGCRALEVMAACDPLTVSYTCRESHAVPVPAAVPVELYRRYRSPFYGINFGAQPAPCMGTGHVQL